MPILTIRAIRYARKDGPTQEDFDLANKLEEHITVLYKKLLLL